MSGKSDMAILYDSSKCTACKGCQVACKQWNQLPSALEDAEYEFSGSYENPKRLGPTTRLRVTFNEVETDDGATQWNFGRDGCQHCTEAACEIACPVGAVHRTSTGAVAIDQAKCIGCRYCADSCPLGVPQWDPAKNKSSKCGMCEDRVANGLKPACVSTCPTGALSFGERDAIVAAAESRLSEIRGGRFPEAELFGMEELGGTHVLTIAARGLEAHGMSRDVRIPAEVAFWQMLKPIAGIGTAAVAGVLGLSFLTGIGYKREPAVQDDAEKKVG